MIIISVAVSIVLVLCIMFFFQEEIQSVEKHYISEKVMQKENDLLEVVSELDELEKDQDIRYLHRRLDEGDMVAYKSLSNNKISNVFNEFGLNAILNQKEESGIIVFSIYPVLSILCEDGYAYGFYYNMLDKPIYVENGEECSLEFEKSEIGWHMHYKTEKIADNWWYYEEYYKVKFGKGKLLVYDINWRPACIC